jgi:RNA recognition motif-containing protein
MVSPKVVSCERFARCSVARAPTKNPFRISGARERVSEAMGRRLYVGNLPYKCTDEELTELFSRAGAVDNVRVMRDQATGRARGFAFVEMATDEDAQKAINELHQFQMEGRALVVNEARPKPMGGGGDYGGGGGGGRGGYGGGGGRREPRW